MMPHNRIHRFWFTPSKLEPPADYSGRRSKRNLVGAVAYFLITGKLPFDRESVLQMLHAHAYEPLVPIHEFKEAVRTDLQRVILRCLEKDPDRRYQDAVTLDKALAACENTSPWTTERGEEWW